MSRVVCMTGRRTAAKRMFVTAEAAVKRRGGRIAKSENMFECVLRTRV